MGDNATPKVPGRSLEHRMFLIFFSPQTEKEHEIVVFLQPSEGKRHNPVYSCGPWVPSRACIWLWQGRAAAWGQPWIRCLTGFGSQTIWLKLPAPKAPAPGAAEDGQHFNWGRVHPWEKFSFAFRAKSHFMAWSFRILIHWSVNTWFLHGRRVYIHTWDSQDSTKQWFSIRQWNST